MEILKLNLYQEITPAEGKIIKDTVENDLCKKITLPLTLTEEEILARFVEVDANDFIIKASLKIYSKLAIRRACRELGIEYKLNGILNKNSLFASDWNDATEIDFTDPVLLEALKEGAFTEEEIQEIIQIIEKG